jgi:hypothetical protein
VNEFFRSKLVAASFFTDMSREVASEGDILNIPGTVEPITHEKVNGSEVTFQKPPETEVKLSVTTWKESSRLIEDRETKLVLNSFGIQSRYLMQQAYACAKDYDSALLGLWSTLSKVIGDGTTKITDKYLRDALAMLDGADVPLEDVRIFMRPEVFWADLQEEAKYYDESQFGGSSSTRTGKIPYLYGTPVVLTTQMPIVTTTTKVLVAHKDAFVHASKALGGGSKEKGVRVQAKYIPQYLGTQLTTDVVYGVAENRDECGVVLDVLMPQI